MNNKNNDSKIFGFSKNVFFLGVVSFFTDISSEMIYPLLPVFLTGVLHASVSFVGLLEGIAESTASVLKLFSGAISDKFGKRKPLIIFGYSMASITRPFMAIAALPWHILSVRFLDRVGKGIRTSPRDALIADSCNKDERGKSFGFHRGMDHAGAVLGPLIAACILYFFPGNYRLVFWLAFIPATLSVFFIFTKVEEIAPREPAKNQFKFTFAHFNEEPCVRDRRVSSLIGRLLFWLCQFIPALKGRDELTQSDKNFKLFLLIIFIFTLSNSSDAFLILRAKDLGVSIAYIPILWVLLHIVKMLFSIPGGILSDKFGRVKIIAIGWLIYFLTYFGFANASSQLHIWLLFGIYGIFFGLTEGVEKAFVADITDCDQRGSAYGMYNFVIGVVALPSSLIFGLIWQYFGAKPAFIYGAILALLAAILIFFAFYNFNERCDI